MHKLLKRLAHDRSGATALELGLVMIPFMLLLMFVLGAGVQLFAAGALEAGVHKAARQMRIGAIRGNTDAAVRNLVCAQMAGLARSCGALQINAVSGASFGAVQTAAVLGDTLSATGYAPGGNGSYVVLQVAFTAPVLLPLPTGMSNTFLSTVSFRNEP